MIAYQQHACSRGAYGGVCVCVHMCVRASGVRARVRARVCVLVCVMRAKAFQHSSFTHAHSFFTPYRPEPWALRVATPPPLEGIDEASARPPGPRRGCAERGCPTCLCCQSLPAATVRGRGRPRAAVTPAASAPAASLDAAASAFGAFFAFGGPACAAASALAASSARAFLSLFEGPFSTLPTPSFCPMLLPLEVPASAAACAAAAAFLAAASASFAAASLSFEVSFCRAVSQTG